MDPRDCNYCSHNQEKAQYHDIPDSRLVETPALPPESITTATIYSLTKVRPSETQIATRTGCSHGGLGNSLISPTLLLVYQCDYEENSLTQSTCQPRYSLQLYQVLHQARTWTKAPARADTTHLLSASRKTVHGSPPSLVRFVEIEQFQLCTYT